MSSAAPVRPEDGEPLLQGGEHRAVRSGDSDRDRHDTAHVGVGRRRSRRSDYQLGRDCWRLADQTRGVVQVHQAQQALHHRDTGVGDRRADRRENRRPAQADQCVRHGGEAGCQRLAEGGRYPGVIGDPLGIPVHCQGGCPVGDRRQQVRPVDTGGDREHRAHSGDGILGGDNRDTAVNGVGGQCEPDIYPGAGHRDAQNNPVLIGPQPRSGG